MFIAVQMAGMVNPHSSSCLHLSSLHKLWSENKYQDLLTQARTFEEQEDKKKHTNICECEKHLGMRAKLSMKMHIFTLYCNDIF